MNDEAQNPLDGVDLVELYGAKNAIEADRVVRILEDEGIEALYRETTASSFPSPADAHYLVLVTANRRDEAKKLIEGAVTDGVLSGDGVFLTG
jgi:hypothetical protein